MYQEQLLDTTRIEHVATMFTIVLMALGDRHHRQGKIGTCERHWQAGYGMQLAMGNWKGSTEVVRVHIWFTKLTSFPMPIGIFLSFSIETNSSLLSVVSCYSS